MNGVGVLSTHRVRSTLIALTTAALTASATVGLAAPATATTVPHLSLAPPATVVLDGQQLVRNKIALLLGDRTVRASLTDLLAQANAEKTQGPWTVTSNTLLPPSGDNHDYLSLAPYWWPTQPQTDANPWGCPYVQKDGVRNPIVDSIPDHADELKAFAAIYNLSLAWYYTGDASYAKRAELDLRTWFLNAATKMNPNLDFAQGIPCQVDGRGIGVIEFSYALTEVVDSTALLDSGAPGWTGSDHRGISAWYTSFLTWLRTSANGQAEAAATNNHGSFYDMMSAALALYTGQRSLAADIVRSAETKRVAVQIQADGYQPLESTRTRSWHYFCFNLVALTRLAQIGQHVGVDLWHYTAPDGGSILGAVDFLIPAATQGQSVWPYPEITFTQYAALDVLHAAADVGDRKAKAALPLVPVEPGGDVFPIHPAAEQLDNIATS
jgi:Alginate lyase